MEAAEAELRSGRPFAEVADEYSDRGGQGGDLDWVARGKTIEEWEALVFALRHEQVSPIFRSRSGFHIVKLHGRKRAGVLPLREIYPVAEELMMKRRRDEAVERFIENVRAKSDIRRVARSSVGDSL
jgi:parvulin-like peptidyl-prolyl isomerase